MRHEKHPKSDARAVVLQRAPKSNAGYHIVRDIGTEAMGQEGRVERPNLPPTLGRFFAYKSQIGIGR